MFKRFLSKKSWFALGAGLLGICLPTGLAAQTLSPGTRITNQAEAFAFRPDKGQTYELLSNRVLVTIKPELGLTLEEDQSVFLTPGATAAFAHRLTNTGNARTTYVLSIANESGDDADFVFFGLIHDTNGNKLIDPGEPELPVGSELTLDPGEVAFIILRGVLPPTLRDGDFILGAVRAEIPGTALEAMVTDRATVGNAEVQLLKGADRSIAAPSEPVVFTLTAINGNVDLTPVTIEVDGRIETAIVIRDEIPRNTLFSRFLATPGTTPLYHLFGSASEHRYTARAPADLTQVDAVAFALDAMLANHAIDVSFEVVLSSVASGEFLNEAVLFHQLPTTPYRREFSNTVIVQVPEECPQITVYSSADFVLPTRVITAGSPLYAEIVAPFLNLSTLERDSLPVEFKTEATGDLLLVEYTETGPNTGIFRRVANPDGEAGIATELAGSAEPGDLVLQTQPRDRMSVTVRGGCVNAVTQVDVFVDPAGVVFDSRTGARIAGVRVELYDLTGDGNGGRAGEWANVFLADGVTPAPSTLVTGSDGVFEFPVVRPSRYQLVVTPPEIYAHPSVVPGSLLPGILGPAQTPVIDDGSYRKEFVVDATTGTIFLDIPIDTATPAGFSLEKEVNRTEVEIGDSVQYTLLLDNSSNGPLYATHIDDLLPAGVSYLEGSARRDGERMVDPEGGKGPHLRFLLGSIADGEQVKVSYRARVGFGAERGDGINRARATSLGPPETRSNLALARIRPEQGVFTDRGVIFGKVFVDLNDNRIHDAITNEETGEEEIEPVVPGVRVFLEDGTYAITDIEGKYSLYGQRAITHVVKLDTYTLPKGYELDVIDNRNANDPDSRFADLRKGELHKANFRLVRPTPDVLQAIEDRLIRDAVFTAEIDRSLQRRFTYEGDPPARERTAGPASGSVDGSVSEVFFQPVLPAGTLNDRNSNLRPKPVSVAPRNSLEEALAEATDGQPGFIDLKDGDTLAHAQARLRIKGALGARLDVQVNGQALSERQRGGVVEDSERKITAEEYVAVNLLPGENTLQVTQFDPFGNERGSETIKVLAPDSLASVSISFGHREPAADGTTPVDVFVRLQDVNGVPVSARTALTLETSLGSWEVEDANGDEAGTQVFLRGGEGRYRLMPPGEPGLAVVRVTSGAIEAEERLPFLPDLRPLVASGILQGRLHLSGRPADQIQLAFGQHGFEESLQVISDQNDEDQSLNGRAAFFLKGQIKGEWLLTAAYDSDKARDAELFRDIEPDKYYPVYGDSSVRGFDAQSSGNLYIRLDRKRSYLLWGDLQTRSSHEARDLGQYNRTLNGFESHYETDRVSAHVFASHGSSRQVVVEVAANGTSGPYNFSAVNGLVNSEQVEILTRDRNQLSVILEVEPQRRFVDYEFEPFTGRILFRRPVASLDMNLNPRFIRITYEVEQGGKKFWTYGADAQVKLTGKIEIGGSYAKDENPLGEYQLSSGNLTLALPFETYLIGEVAASEDAIEGEGTAGRIELRRNTGKTDARVFHGETSDDFINPSSRLTRGRVESGAEMTHRLTGQTRVHGQAVYTEDAVTGDHREGVRLDLIHRFANNVEVEVGGRVSNEVGTTANPSLPLDAGKTYPAGASPENEVRSLRGRVTTPVPYAPDARVFADFEQDVSETSKRRFLVGGDYQVSSRTRLYATHELIDSLGGEFELNDLQQTNRTLVGLETEYRRDAQLFNEYRVRDSVDGRHAESSTGLRNQWHLAEGLRLNTSLERIQPLSGLNARESTSVTGAIEYTAAKDWKASARAEWRGTDDQDSVLSTIGYARKLDANWTFLGKGLVYHQDNKAADTDDILQGRVQSGLAWRQTEKDVWNALFLYEYRYEDGSTFVDPLGTQRRVHLLSASTNYQPNEKWLWMNRVAAKKVSEHLGDWADSTAAAQINGRVLYLFEKRWDAGLNYAVLMGNGADKASYALGPEVGIWLKKHLRLGLGYNFWGFVDNDFNPSGDTQSGFFITFSLKFDEDSLRFGSYGEDRP